MSNRLGPGPSDAPLAYEAASGALPDAQRDGAGAQERAPRAIMVRGVAWALITVLVWGGWPAFTRLSVTQTVTPQDLVFLRYAVGGAILTPVLIWLAPRMPRWGWREGIVLTVFQGAPLALLVTMGVQYAPASHMGALSPGMLPLFAAIWGVLFYNERLTAWRKVGVALICGGGLLMAGLSLSTFADDTWKGDLLFVCAGMMGSIYAVRMKHCGLSPEQGAALMGVYSMVAYLPLYFLFWFGQSRLAEVAATELLMQAVYQGVLMGALALFSLSWAIVALGSVRGLAFISLVPVLGTIFGFLILHEIPSLSETAAVAAISFGVLLAAGVQLGWRGKGAL
jgi:drug/metabolite transporter (DMT)-like permease